MKKDIKMPLTIDNAESVTKQLKTWFKSSKTQVIDLSEVEKIDLSGIQILISSQKYAENKKIKLSFTGSLRKNVFDKLSKNGFKTVPSSEDEELYLIRRNSSEL